jgi:hypothetical protein
MKNTVFRNVTPCGSCKDRRVERTPFFKVTAVRTSNPTIASELASIAIYPNVVPSSLILSL